MNDTRTIYYRLDGDGIPVPCDGLEWAAAFETSERRIALREQDGVVVSTVFLGIDHQFVPGPPLLFETMIFGLDDEEPCWRYSTRAEAEAGHDEVCREVFEHGGPGR